MKQNGAVVITDQFPAGLQYMAPNTVSASPLYIKDAKGMTKAQYQTETCDVCHGPGATADTAGSWLSPFRSQADPSALAGGPCGAPCRGLSLQRIGRR